MSEKESDEERADKTEEEREGQRVNVGTDRDRVCRCDRVVRL